MVQEPEVVVRLLLQVQARAGLPQRFRALEGVDAVAEARLGAAVDVPDAVRVVDMIAFRREGGVDALRHGGEDFVIGTAGGEPEVGAVLRHGLRLAASGEKEPGEGPEKIFTHIFRVVSY